MDFFDLIAAFGGLALFLFGMHEMSAGLERVSGGALERILERFTSNIFKGVLLGFIVTAMIQSSSATTVLVVGLVNSGLLKLRQAIGIMMGANIGTTITGQITRLIDLDTSAVGPALKLLSPSHLAPLMAIVSIVFIMASKSNNKQIVGQIGMGFSILFTGMLMMADAVKPLADSEVFLSLLQEFSQYPALGILAGMIVTAIIQSSSASVGMLQALSATGALTFSAAYPIILGQNIGTCVTSVLSSIGTSKNAKRTAAVHVYFNVIGTALFMVIMAVLHAFGMFGSIWNQPVDSGMIANFHTIFNVVTTLILLPFAGVLERFAVFTIREKKEDDEDDQPPELDERFLAIPSIALSQATSHLFSMAKLSIKNVRNSMKMFDDYSSKKAKKMIERESQIDHMEGRLGQYLIHLNDVPLSTTDSKQMTFLYHVMPEFERIGDCSIRLLDVMTEIKDKKIRFSQEAKEDLEKIYHAIEEMLDICLLSSQQKDTTLAKKAEPLETIIDTLDDVLKARHVQRLRANLCGMQAGLLYLEILSNLEQIADHCSNIAVYTLMLIESENFDHHRYRREILRSLEYNRMLSQYYEQYLTYINKGNTTQSESSS